MAVGKLVKDVPADAFVVALAAHLKKGDKMVIPSWSDVIKTGAHKELPPQDSDWYYVRAAAIARRVYLRGGSIGGFAKVFGGKNRRGCKRNIFATSSKGLIRHILQQLETMNIIAKYDKKEGGRRITSNGRRELDTIAGQVVIASSGFAA